MRSGDRVIIGVALGLAALSWPAALLANGGLRPGNVVAVTGPASTRVVPLSGERSLTVQGLHGTVEVVVDDGSVRVRESDCPDQLCVEQGPVSAGAIVCAPNGVTVRVGGGDDALDAYIR